MAFTKFASFECSQVLDLKGSKERVKTASLSKLADFEDFRTEDGYLYARIRAISSRVNKNHDGWPSVELAGGEDVFRKHQSSEGRGFTVEASKGAEYGFSTFLGKPIFVDHHNSDPSRARGVIVDAKLHVEDHRTAAEHDPYYASAPDNHMPPTWIELLLEVDAKSFPKLAQAIIEGSNDPAKGIDGFSMGCDVERSVCNICKNSATSPQDFCAHIRMKGALHNYKDEHGNRKTAKSYEDCFGIKFFEISAVFDPADETALLREVRASVHHEANSVPLPCPDCSTRGAGPTACDTCGGIGHVGQLPITRGIPAGDDGTFTQPSLVPFNMGQDHAHEVMNAGFPNGVAPDRRYQGSTRTADNPPPQDDLLRAPEQINTLRQVKTCDVCGSDMEDGVCTLCGHVEPPEHFNNPDLQKAREMDQAPIDAGPDGSPERRVDDPALDPALLRNVPQPEKPMPLSSVKGDMQWTVVSTPRIAGRINSIERPVTPGSAPSTNEPRENVIKDEHAPVTSKVRTAGDMLASVGRDKEQNMDKVADSATTVSAPDVRTDTTGVGGVMEATNEEASKADAQVAVDAKGGTGVEDVSADKTDHVDHGDEHSKNIQGTPTDTWSGTDGNGVTKQESPVGGDVFPSSDEGVKKSHDSGAFPADDNGLSGGKAVQGVKPVAEQFGDRVNVLEPTTSPSNNSGPTTQWTGTDGNGVTKQQDPVTNVVATPFTSKVVNALKLVDLEIESGLLAKAQKFARLTELGEFSDERVAAELAYAERVRTAGLAKAAPSVVKQAKKLPVLGRPSEPRVASTHTDDSDPLKGTLFGF
ncbi:hypothetical protein [Candidatus Solirubrobacter pratensis]|uniref:hypothetical protein n=1 Tax=Candidatus Solirubrobacter pratensis TaxID=1298857 RepID=UPI0003F65F7D|nr:hypothetical protein [Candidatus Solirubrobacter pratensis]